MHIEALIHSMVVVWISQLRIQLGRPYFKIANDGKSNVDHPKCKFFTILMFFFHQLNNQ